MNMRLEEIKVGVDIRFEGNSYVAYVDHLFYCSGDTFMEVVQELNKNGIV